MDIYLNFNLIMLQLKLKSNQLEKEYPNVGTLLATRLKIDEKN